jgi:hypothetical protein
MLDDSQTYMITPVIVGGNSLSSAKHIFNCMMVNDDSRILAALVRKEIADETDRETGRSKQISSVPIHLSIYSPNGKITII